MPRRYADQMSGYREHQPPATLAPYVACVWTQTAGPRAGQRVLPDGCIDVMLHLGDSPRVVVVGAMTRAKLVPAGEGRAIVAVRFRPGGATRLLGVGAEELTDEDVPLADLGGAWRREVERLTSGRELLAALIRRHPTATDPRVDLAARALWSDRPPSVDALAKRLGWTRQHLGRRFRDEVGLSPKLFTRVARMQRALSRLRAGSLADVAVELGYFDEAHMAHDFRELIGTSPGEARRGSILPIPRPWGEASSSHEDDHHESHRRPDRGPAPLLGRPARVQEDGRSSG
jgi:AraC-like DNA-binding protein